MRINFGTGDTVSKYSLGLREGIHEIELPIDAEILGCGLSKGMVALWVGAKLRGAPTRKVKFLLQPLGKELPREDFKYYFYVGTIAKYELSVFEVV